MMMRDLARLGELLAQYQRSVFVQYVQERGAEPPDDIDATLALFGLTLAGVLRGANAALALPLRAEDDEAATRIFALVYAWGEADALRRAKLTLTSPKAKGREAEVLDRLIAGDNIVDALREPVAAPGPASGGAILPFPSSASRMA
jgi:hypothetical protein